MAPERTRRWYDAGFYGTDTMRDRLAAGADSYAHVPFRVWSPQRPAETTLGELHSRGVAVGGALLAAGVGKGDVVALQMPNWLEAAVLYHACTEIGAVVLPIIHIYGPAEVGYILDESGAAMLVTPDTWMGVDYSGREVGNRPEMVRVFVGDDPPSGPGVVPFEELEANAGSDYPRPDLDPDDVHLLCYTSGTTAKPKGVQHSHNTMLAESRQLAEATGARRRRVPVPEPGRAHGRHPRGTPEPVLVRRALHPDGRLGPPGRSRADQRRGGDPDRWCAVLPHDAARPRRGAPRARRVVARPLRLRRCRGAAVADRTPTPSAGGRSAASVRPSTRPSRPATRATRSRSGPTPTGGRCPASR